jgi:hypothetical protein
MITHPLADAVMAMFDKHATLSVTTVASEFGSRSCKEYRIAATEVLHHLHAQGRVIRHGKRDRRMTDYGYYYTPAGERPTSNTYVTWAHLRENAVMAMFDERPSLTVLSVAVKLAGPMVCRKDRLKAPGAYRAAEDVLRSLHEQGRIVRHGMAEEGHWYTLPG